MQTRGQSQLRSLELWEPRQRLSLLIYKVAITAIMPAEDGSKSQRKPVKAPTEPNPG